MSADGPRRLLDYGDDLNGLLRGALEAERGDKVDDARLDRIAKALSVAAAAPAAGGSDAAATAARTKAASTSGGWLASKGPAILLAAAAIGGLVVFGLSNRAPEPVAAPPPAMTVAARPAPLAPPEPAPTQPVIATVSPADLPSAPPAGHAPSAARPTKAPADVASEGDEIALIARAHDALRRDPARSLALCREHESRYAGSHFQQEREAVAIEALVYLGRTEEARRRWSTFQERYPSSSHRVHLESLFAAPSAP